MPANGAFASVVMPLLRRFSWVQSVAHDPCGSAAAGRKLVVAKRLRQKTEKFVESVIKLPSRTGTTAGTR